MNEILRALEAAAHAPRPALIGEGLRLNYAQTAGAAQTLATRLQALGVRRLGLLADNGPAWVICDLACLYAGITLVPVPPFFSPAQRSHVLESAGLDHLLLGTPEAAAAGLAGGEWLQIAGSAMVCVPLPGQGPADGCKITYTSGTTGQPKGVCLSPQTLEAVALSLHETLAPLRIAQHLTVLPLATLLENLAGVYVPLLSGASMQLASLTELGYSGASGLKVPRFLTTVARHRPQSLVLVPQLLQTLVAAASTGWEVPRSLRFVAVGGARVTPTLISRARALGIPAHEGYGLSECGSVVAVNAPGADRPGSVGRPLPHVRVELAEDGEILVHGPHHDGYLGEPPLPAAAPVATGDLGHLDADGYLYVTGRKRNVFITSYGRNVSPEWVEAELCAEPAIAQAAVFGEGRPWNIAILVSSADEAALAEAVARANARLPDYARVGGWLKAHTPFAPAQGLLTANGRPRREPIRQAYEAAIDTLYNDLEVPCPSTSNS